MVIDIFASLERSQLSNSLKPRLDRLAETQDTHPYKNITFKSLLRRKLKS